MKHIINFIPARQIIITGAAIGIATGSITTGIVLIIIFSFTNFIKSIKS